MSNIQILEKASLNDLLNEEVFEHIAQELYKNIEQVEYNPEQIQQILPPMHLMKAHIKLIVLKFKEENLIDEGLADLLCSESDQFSIAQQQNSITQKNREKLEKTLHATREKIKSLLLSEQLEPEIAKIFLYILLLDKFYLETIDTN